MKQLNYWIWLHDCLPARSNTADIFRVYAEPQEIYEDPAKAVSGLFSPRTLERMEHLPLAESYRQQELCAREGIDLLTPEDPEYPPLLREIRDYPVLLYAKGNTSVLQQRLPFAIVGTRKPGLCSKHAASLLAERLSACNFVICSGGALGIDSAAHLGALAAGAPTVAVLGGGFLSHYLQSNKELRKVIAANGLLLSETNPQEEPHKGTFPNRNRIIAGMTVGTLVVEAGRKSGSLLTARDAGLYDREVMAVPGKALGSAYAGAEDLLEDGATCVNCAMDVIAQLQASYGQHLQIPEDQIPLLLQDMVQQENWTALPNLKTPQIEEAYLSKEKEQKKELTDPVTADAEMVYECFSGRPLSIETLLTKTALPVNRLLGALTELELLGYLQLQSDRNYTLKQDG